jgi:hypothetical protein
MREEKRIYVDFQKIDNQRRLVLTCLGTIQDLARHGIELKEGLVLTFYSDDADEKGNPDELIVQGRVSYDEVQKHWTATIDWRAIRHVSELHE